MASKVPRDPNLPPEMRRFLDDQARGADSVSDRVTTLEGAALTLASQAEAEAGTDNVKYMSSLRVAQAIAALGDLTFLHVRDEKTANTDGGTFTQAADQTRVLNTAVTNTITGASLATNQITLPAGTYAIFASAPAHNVDEHRAWLYNTTDAATTILGSSERSDGLADITTTSWVVGLFTIAAQKVFELRHRCTNTGTTTGFGFAVNINSAVEVYSSVLIIKL